MNHFFLWIGDNPTNARLGKVLLGKHKSIEHAVALDGPNWSFCLANQKDGLGAFPHDRIRSLKTAECRPETHRRLFWCGHAWSEQDGNQPATSTLQHCSAEADISHLARKVRENTDGVYALFIIDDSQKRIAIAADPLGSFHIYFRILPDGIAVSSSSAVLAGLQPLSPLDPLGVQELCSHAVANEDRSIWADVKKLRSGQIAILDTGRKSIELAEHRPLLSVLDAIRGYANDPVPFVYQSISGTLDILNRHGGRGEMYRELPWATDLTGGNDSRALFAAILAKRINSAATVTGGPGEADVRISEELANKLGLKHFTRTPLDAVSYQQFSDALSLTDGEYDAIEYAGIADVHHRHIADHLQFSLNGAYCELARGHAFRMGLPGMLRPDAVSSALCKRSPLDLQHPSVRHWNQALTLKAEVRELFSAPARAASENYFPALFEHLMSYSRHLPQHSQLDLIHIDLRHERWLGRLLSSTNQIWPAISPWGFSSPLNAILTSAPQHRRNGLLTRELTLRYAPEIAFEPLYTGNPAIPFSFKHAHHFLPLIAFFTERAANKIKARFIRSSPTPTRSLLARQAQLCSTRQIRDWTGKPLLAGSGLFDNDKLMLTLALDRPKSDADYRLWCRLLTIEGALRRQAEFSAENTCAGMN